MKRIILIGIFVISLFVVSCNKENIVDNNGIKGELITVNANINNEKQTKLAFIDDVANKELKISWSDKDTFTVYKGSIMFGQKFVKGDGNSFSGKKPPYQGDDKYYAVYGDDITHPYSGPQVTVNIANQIGTIDGRNGIRSFMVAETEDITDTTTLNFNHKLAILKLNLTLPSDVKATKVDKVIVLGLHNMAQYNFTDSTYDYSLYEYKKEITATNNTNGFEIKDRSILAYISVFPEENIQPNSVTILAVVGEENYVYTMTKGRTLNAGSLVNVKATLAKKNIILQSRYYMWDAYEPFQYITSGTWEPGSSWYNSSSVAKASCKDCPTYDQIKMYLGQDVYWDENADAFILQDGAVYTKGLWIMKKAYITDFDGNRAPKRDNVVPIKGAPADKSKYFFLPACGQYNGKSGNFIPPKSGGLYWLNAPNSTYSYNLIVDSEKVCLGFNERNNGFIPFLENNF